jgi:hypothetical protein
MGDRVAGQILIYELKFIRIKPFEKVRFLFVRNNLEL